MAMILCYFLLAIIVFLCVIQSATGYGAHAIRLTIPMTVSNSLTVRLAILSIEVFIIMDRWAIAIHRYRRTRIKIIHSELLLGLLRMLT